MSMARPIKYRAWHIPSNSWLDDDEVVVSYFPGKGGIAEVCISEIMDVFSDSDIIWVQFTGLLDKNGKEIYEGDLLRLKNRKGEPVNLQEVYWDNEAASFDWRAADDSAWPDIFTGFHDDYEVVGNIYEGIGGRSEVDKS